MRTYSPTVSPKQYWANRDIEPHYMHQAGGLALARLMQYVRPESIFEFGCGCGRNLAALQGLFPDAALSGIDINPAMVAEAQRKGLQVEIGDENEMRGAEHDVVLTLSVLCHIDRDIGGVLRELWTITHKRLILIEPYIEGVCNFYPAWCDEPYSYGHAYPAILTDLGIPHGVARPFPIQGPHELCKKYHVWTCDKDYGHV